MKKYILLFCLLFFCVPFLLSAQNQKVVDSLFKIYQESPDTLKVKILNQLRGLYANNDFEKALTYAQEALDLSKKIQYSKGIATSLDGLGTIYEYQGDFPKGLEYKFEALKIYEKDGNKKGISQISNNLGVLFFRHKDYKNALEYYKKALAIAEDTKDETSVSIYQLNIGEVYQESGDYEKAIEYEMKSLEISERLDIKDNIAYAYGIMGQVYVAQKNYEKALDYELKALKVFEELDDKQAVCEYLLDIAYIYLKTDQIEKAIENTEQCIQISKQIDAINWLRDAQKMKAEIYEAKGDFKEAYLAHKTYLVLKDSILNETSLKKIAQVQALYGAEKKQIEIELLKHDKQWQSFSIYALIVFSILGVVFTIFLYRNNVQKHTANQLLKLSNEEINLQKEEIEAQKDSIIEQNEILEEKNEEIAAQSSEIQRKSEDITSSIKYAKRIQEAVLPKLSDIQQVIPQHFVFYKPRDIVSGDFYWFTKLIQEGQRPKILLAVADCTGHGVPAAFMSMIGNNLLNQIVNEKEITEPDKILNELHRNIRQALHQDTSKNMDGMDISIIMLEMPDDEVREIKVEFAAANSSVIFIKHLKDAHHQTKALELKTIKGNKLSIGGEQRESERIFTKHSFVINPAGTDAEGNQTETLFYLFSDGFQDQFGGEKNKKFMITNFRKLLLSIHHLGMEEQKVALERTLDEWMQHSSEKQIDDILVFGFRI